MDARYVHVLRHGLDMVYSRNQQQLRNWGGSFQLDPEDLAGRNRFEFWYRSNHLAITTAEECLPGRYLKVGLEELCLETERVVGELLHFVGLSRAGSVPPDVLKVPQLPESFQRYLKSDLSWVDSDVELKLSEFGYSV
jgi:hypothetical protein